jgi:tetratricopeptide (TPR) repeat protein
MLAVSRRKSSQSLHFSRWLLIFFVSFWISSSAFGLDEFAEWENLNDKKQDSKGSSAEKPSNEKPPDKTAQPTSPRVAPPPDVPVPKKAPAPEQPASVLKECKEKTPVLWKKIDTLERKDFQTLMKCHYSLKQADDLLRVSNLLIAKNEKDYEAYHYQGEAYLLKKKDKEAQDSFTAALKINPKFMPSYLSIESIYEQKKNLYELRVLYEDMIKAFGPRGDILTKLCRCYTQDGLNESGLKYCNQATQKDPTVADNFVYIGLIHAQAGDKAPAKQALQKAAEKFPNSEFAQYNLGKFLADDKDYIDSYKAYKKCVSSDPKSERCLLGYATSGFEIQKYQEAYDTFKKLCKMNRNQTVYVRRSQAALRNTGPKDWAQKFQELSDYCSY